MRTKCIIFGQALRIRVKKFYTICVKLIQKALKIAITTCKFSKFFRGSMPPNPLQSLFSFSISFQFVLPKKNTPKKCGNYGPPPFEIFRYTTAQGVRFIAVEEVRNCRKFHTLKIFLKMAGGRVHTSHPSPTHLDPPLSPDHKLQKPSKEFGIFQSPGTISFILFY